MNQLRSLSPDQYHIGWICTLKFELATAIAMLDERHQNVITDSQDHNTYALGQLCGHNIAIACLPAGFVGSNPAASVAKDMSRTFKFLRFGLLIGIGGGIPRPGYDIRLGDVIVSQPTEIHGGVIQFDMGETHQGGSGFIRKGTLNTPPITLLTAVNNLQAEHEINESQMVQFLTHMLDKNKKMISNGYGRPNIPDRLFNSTYIHSAGPNCESCDQEVSRPERDPEPQVHYGLIASGNKVIRDARLRDQIGQDLGAICLDRVAAGMLDFPCLVIKGISDYSDSHSNDIWQKYAAGVATAYAKELLSIILPEQVKSEQPIQVSDTIAHQILAEIRDESREFQQSQRDQQLSDKELQCLSSFKTSSYESQKDINPKRVPGTCRWVLDNPKFVRWKDSNVDDVIWISADPGCGKSVLSRVLVDEVLPKDGITICYFFFKDNPAQNSLSTALCALIHQLLDQQRQLIQDALPLWGKNGETIQTDADELWKIFISAATSENVSSPVVCVLDALDECLESNRLILKNKLNSFYGKATASTKRKHSLKFLFTSRPYSDIQRAFQRKVPSSPIIHLPGTEESAKIRQEINHVIRIKLEDMAYDLGLSDTIKADIERTLLGMEHRTYLWLYLAMEDIEKMYSKSLVPHLEAINLVPQSVEQAYEKILARIDKDGEERVRKVFHIIIGARRPLTVNEMAIAIGIAMAPSKDINDFKDLNIDESWIEKKMCDICGLFIYINDSKVYLIHHTAKEFLINTELDQVKGSSWKHCLQPSESEQLLARICVEYLSLSDFAQSHGPRKGTIKMHWSNPQQYWWYLGTGQEQGYQPFLGLLSYSAQHWTDHFRCSPNHDSLLDKGYRLLQSTNEQFSFWVPIFWGFHHPYNLKGYGNPAGLHLASFAGLEPVLNAILETTDINIDMQTYQDDTALTLAASRGYESIVTLLLDRGANINLGTKSALGAAADNCHKELVELLVKKGAEVNFDNGYALRAISKAGNRDIAEFLIENGADVNAETNWNETPLELASSFGHQNIVSLLLENGARVNAGNGQALKAAAENGHQNVVNILLDNRAQFHDEALSAASAKGHKAVVEVLLKKGDFSAGLGDSLEAASRGGHKDILKLLLEKGPSINALNIWGETPLQSASNLGHKMIVEMLLDLGADVNLNNGCALVAASKTGRKDMVELLFKNGADFQFGGKEAVKAACKYGQEAIVKYLLEKGTGYDTGMGEALGEASGNGHKVLVKLLLDHGADCNVQNSWNETPIENAIKSGRIDIVGLLINCGADVNVGDGLPLITASTRGHRNIVGLLLEHGANVHARRGASLLAASREGHKDVAQLLLENGAEVNARSKHGETALEEALKRKQRDVSVHLLKNGAKFDPKNGTAFWAVSAAGFKDVVELLLEQGANVDSSNQQGKSAIQGAMMEGHKDLFQFLLNKGADVTRTSSGNPLLHSAVAKDDMDYVRMLLNSGVDVNARGPSGSTALFEAIGNENENIMKFLLANGAEINAQEKSGATVLFQATRYSDNDVLKFLLANGADINLEDKMGATLLQIASRRGDEDMVKFLLDNGANVNNSAKRPPLVSAVARKKKAIVQLLLDRGADINVSNPLMTASLAGNKDMVIFLIENGADINAEDGSALIAASKGGHKEVIQLLLEKRTGTEIFGVQDALTKAAGSGRTDIVQLLLETGVDINSSNGKPLIDASKAGNFDMVKLLLDKGADPMRQEQAALYQAADAGYKDIVEILLPPSRDDLIYPDIPVVAAENGHREIVQLFFQRIGDMTEAIQLAQEKGSNDALQLLKDVVEQKA